ncbi:hypothetical protein [Aquincola tertiaricarbonis]|uniref:hypothetical protein n=1 Tax=Aquincola tertiaricarbonis TaxID=391953 RepID=UPI000614C598|nr:hypothetical protein [Aquincola tertiaricarbonis]
MQRTEGSVRRPNTLNCLRERGAIGFWACSVAEHYRAQGLERMLPLEVPIELPPVGLMMLRGRLRTPAAEQLIGCLRESAARRPGRR